MDQNLTMNTRDCLQRAWVNSMEMVRDFEMYSKKLENKDVAQVFKKFAEEQGKQAHELKELYNQFDDSISATTHNSNEQ
ncbi:MAG: hypothetical protein WBL93_01695 [Lutisporaceae bacterium]